MGLDRSDSLAVTAIVISLIALVSTIGQIVQQYIGTSEGYRRCRSSVMGLWGKATRRKFDWGDMRFEVLFETPAIFVAQPNNLFGPLPKSSIYYLDGTDASYHGTLLMDEDQEQSSIAERASWLTLLSLFQRLERESRMWEMKNLLPDLYKAPQYSMCVQLQRKLQSWSFVPAGVVKPYTSTTIAHLVTMVAMLGLHWVVFDQASGNVIAEGDSLVVTSALVQGLGLLVSFDIAGRHLFADISKRVIPNREVKNLCFGFIPTILRFDKLSNKIRLGSRDEIIATLEFLGCNLDTISKYERRHSHNFSLTFEILGMLGQCIRIRSSNFRRLPNPTTDYWPGDFDMTGVTKYFQHKMKEPRSYGNKFFTETLQFERVCELAANLNIYDGKAIVIQERTHDALDECTRFMNEFPDADIRELVGTHIGLVVDELNNPRSNINNIKNIMQEKGVGHAGPKELWIDFYLKKLWPAVIYSPRPDGTPLRDEDAEHRSDLWLTLIFRMLCWLSLHDCDPEDMKVVPSNVRGSRLPVYIG